MIHYSKKDRWLIGLVLAAILLPLVLGIIEKMANKRS